MTSLTFTQTAPPRWLLDFWAEIDQNTFGRGFDCFVEDATCNLGVADWQGRETIRENLRAFPLPRDADRDLQRRQRARPARSADRAG